MVNRKTTLDNKALHYICYALLRSAIFIFRRPPCMGVWGLAFIALIDTKRVVIKKGAYRSMFWPLAEVLSTLPKVFICCHIFTIRVCLLSSCQSTRGIITRPTTGVHHSAARASTFFHCQSSSVRRDQLRFICDIMHNECYHCLFSKHNTAPLPCQ